jgi:hypothetical protein
MTRLSLIAIAMAFSCNVLNAQTITVQPLLKAPVLDGKDDDWSGLKATVIPLHKSIPQAKTAVTEVSLKAGIFGEEVFFYVQWADPTESAQHKPFVWNDSQQKYVEGDQREDRFALEFRMAGDYSTDWFSGKSFTADMWHWKASRTNPLGHASDQRTIISRDKLLRAYEGVARDGKPLYILRPWDAGDMLYTTKRYSQKQEAIMPKYVINPTATGSTMDVYAKGVWHDGQWHLELKRRLNTGHDDDVVFVRGQSVPGGMAIFESSNNDDHAISDVLTFQF